jgi:hypothetical protein
MPGGKCRCNKALSNFLCLAAYSDGVQVSDTTGDAQRRERWLNNIIYLFTDNSNR